MEIFAAPVGTYILSSEDEDFRLVVVGFLHVTGNRADPVTLVGFPGGVTEPHAILHPDGAVTHRNSGKLFADENDWREAMALVALVKEPDPGPDLKPILWGDKSAKTRSYWSWPGANAVFELEGGHAYPNDTRIQKIKRDEFQELKRGGFIQMDPHTGVVAPEAAEEPEVEADDDTDNLI